MGQRSRKQFSFQDEIDRKSKLHEGLSLELEEIRQKISGCTIDCETGVAVNCLGKSTIGGHKPHSTCEANEVPALMWSTHHEDSRDGAQHTVCWACAIVLRDTMRVRSIPLRKKLAERGYQLELKARRIKKEIKELEKRKDHHDAARERMNAMFKNNQPETLADHDENRTREPAEDPLTQARAAKAPKKGKDATTNSATKPALVACTGRMRGSEALSQLLPEA